VIAVWKDDTVTGLFVEERMAGSSSITQDVAKHLYARSLCGKVAIVAERPAVFLSALKKQWMKVERQLRHERSSTLNPTRLLEFTHELPRIQTLSFTAKAPIDEPRADVQIATVEQFLEWAPQCRTMYVTYQIANEQLHLITSWMPKNSLVVRYQASIRSR